MSGAVVFLGPTLAREAALALAPDAVLLGPARQGDVYRAVRQYEPDVIGLIDGAFLDVASVWHREIVWALAQGVVVLGGASMGALRAAELEPFGMVGIGAVFGAYRDGALPGWEGVFEDDDEVAVVHAPAELGWRPLSDAMVDLRAALDGAAAAGVIADGERQRLARAMKALHFPERSLARLGALAGAEFERWAAGHAVSVKAADARALLGRLGGPHAAPPPVTMARAMVWEHFVADAELSLADARRLDALRQDGAAWEAVADAAMGRVALLRDAAPADGARARQALDRFRQQHGLHQRADLDRWMAEHGLDAAGLAALMARQAALRQAAQQADAAELQRAMLDVLHLSGRDRPEGA